MFQTCQSEVALVDLCAGALKADNAHTLLAQPNGVETHEEHPEPVFKHLDQKRRPPPSVIPLRKRKGFMAFLKGFWGSSRNTEDSPYYY